MLPIRFLVIWIATALVAVSLLPAAPAKTAEAKPQAVWRPAGFGGAGNFLGVYFDPRRSGVVYATSDVGGLFRSEDAGTSWETRNDGLGNFEVAAFAIDPFDSNTLYAGVGAFPGSDKAGIYVSHNAGRSWRHLASTAANGIAFRVGRTPFAIALDPSTLGTILSGSRSAGVWRSTDAGATWRRVLEPPRTSVPPLRHIAGAVIDDPQDRTYRAPVSVVAFDPAANGTVFVGFFGGGLWRSDQSGREGTWEQVNRGLPLGATVLHVAPGPGDVVYAALGADGIYKSEDRGRRWRAVNGGVPTEQLRVLSAAVDPVDPDIAYFTQEFVAYQNQFEGVWKTEDGGRTWTQTGPVSYDLRNDPTSVWRYYPRVAWHVAVDPNARNRLLFVETWGVYRSDDAGREWRQSVRGAQNTCVTDLHYQNASATLFATHLDAGLLASRDGGETWRAVLPRSPRQRESLAGHYWRILGVEVGAQTVYYVAVSPWGKGRNLVLRTTDMRRWETVFDQPIPPGGRGLGQITLTADPSTPTTLYLVQDNGKIMRSTDAGDTWRPTKGQPDAVWFNDLVVDSRGTLFLATHLKGLWRSLDDGDSWQRILPRIWRVHELDTAPGGAVFAAANDGNLYRSRDAGNTWDRLTDLAPERESDGTSQEGVTVAVDPANPDHVLFGRTDVWHFADRGTGLWETWDGGGTWKARSQGLGLPRVGSVAFDGQGNIFAGTFCGGIWRLDTAVSG